MMELVVGNSRGSVETGLGLDLGPNGECDVSRQRDAEQRGFTIVHVFEDSGRSGLRMDGRDGLQSLMLEVQSCAARFHAILVYDVSRWGRFQDADGLKRPITVSPRKTEADSANYDLVCGQGRIEAFIQLGQTEIPAIVIEAEESDCLVMSLVENCARRQHRAIDLLQDIGTLRGRGYNDHEIAAKIGVTSDYIRMIGTLFEKGEERLVAAVEAGILPINMAIEIARSNDEDVQHALTQAYTEKKLRGRKLVAVRRLIEQRRRSGKQIHDSRFGRRDGAKRPLTGESIIRVYRQEADKQKLLVKKAEVTQSRLLFIVEATALIRLRTGEGHPQLGHGLLGTLQLPYFALDKTINEQCAFLNSMESLWTDIPQFGCWHPYKSRGDQEGLAFSSFVPNALYQPGIATHAAFWMLQRVGWVHDLMWPDLEDKPIEQILKSRLMK